MGFRAGGIIPTVPRARGTLSLGRKAVPRIRKDSFNFLIYTPHITRYNGVQCDGFSCGGNYTDGTARPRDPFPRSKGCPPHPQR